MKYVIIVALLVAISCLETAQIPAAVEMPPSAPAAAVEPPAFVPAFNPEIPPTPEPLKIVYGILFGFANGSELFLIDIALNNCLLSGTNTYESAVRLIALISTLTPDMTVFDHLPQVMTEVKSVAENVLKMKNECMIYGGEELQLFQKIYHYINLPTYKQEWVGHFLMDLPEMKKAFRKVLEDIGSQKWEDIGLTIGKRMKSTFYWGYQA